MSASSRADRRRLLQSQIAIERAEFVLAIHDLRASTNASSLARGVTGGLWRSLLGRAVARGEAAGGPVAAMLLTGLRRYPLLASTVTALLPFARRYVVRRVGVKRLAIGAALAGLGWWAVKSTRKT